MKLVFLGPPGAGKGTLASLAKATFGVVHVSTGDIFRANIRNQTPLGVRVKAILDSGALVPDDVTIEIVKDRLEQPDVRPGYLLDGFPRTIAQAEALAQVESLNAVVNFVLEDEEIVRRLSGRRVCKSCGAGFHTESRKPEKEGICDSCGGSLIQRADDEPAAIEERLRVYKSQTAPLIEWYRQRGLLHDIDASPPPEAVLSELKRLLTK
ncbi:MAG: adenylate kinase [Spirochaetales bacterium]